MAKTQVVFTNTDAIVLIDNDKLIKYSYDVLLNPTINCLDVPTKYWKMGRNNSVVSMINEEMAVRDYAIDKYGSNDTDIFQPEKEVGSPVSKPFVIQEIKNTPILHIETKEIRHLDIKPIASFDVNPLTLKPVDLNPLYVHVHPITIKPLEIIIPRRTEIIETIKAVLMFAILVYAIIKR